MTIQEAYKQLLYQLYEVYDDREAANIADMVIEHVTAQRRIDRIVNKQMPVSTAQQQEIDIYTQQLLQHKPIQYVLHEAWFAGMKFYVDENVLIPRPETEELVEWIADLGLPVTGYQFPVSAENEANNNIATNKTQSPVTGNRQPVTILDIGTGSGCIPIALKKRFAEWTVNAVDISAGALEVAKKNAAANNVDVTFTLINILDESAWQQQGMYDVIVSNPPYIKQSESASMHANVLAFEPHTALFVPDDDALLFYKKIADFALQHLNTHGLLFFEINEALGKEVFELLVSKGFKDIELRKDLQGKDRMVKAVYPGRNL